MFAQPPSSNVYSVPVSCAAVWAGKPLTGLASSSGVVHAVDGLRRNAMHYAAAKNDVMSLADLADMGVSASLQDVRGQSPLHYAVLHGAHDAVQTLAELPGVLVDAQNREGATALWLAAQRGDERSAALLLQHGARPNLPNSEGATPLHAAAARGDAALLRLLLQHGAHLARPDLAGDTPLHWAVREERAAAAALLAASGASLAARNEDGETPAELARACNLPHMEAAIAAGAKKALSAP